MTAPDTKATILDAAEALFAEQGYAATSLRQLTTMAHVNLAAVHYHFGSKADLAKAVLARRVAPINAERLRRLAALTGRPSVEAILRALLEPPLRGAGTLGDGTAAHGFCRVFGRIMVEQPPFLREFLDQQFRALARHFIDALQRAMPAHSATTLWWRLHFLIGSMAHTLQNAATLSHLSDDLLDPHDVDEVVEQMVAFAVGGLTAARQVPPEQSPPKAATKRGGTQRARIRR